MRIGELAGELGISPDTLRFYEKRGLIRAHRRPNGYRHYGQDAVLTVRFILTARKLGFTLAEIARELPGAQNGEISAERLGEILKGKLQMIDQRIMEMTSLRSDLETLLDRVCPVYLSAETADSNANRSADTQRKNQANGPV